MTLTRSAAALQPLPDGEVKNGRSDAANSTPIGAIGVFLGASTQWTAVAATTPPAENPAVESIATETIRSLGLQTELPRLHPLPEWSLDLSNVILWAVAAAAVVVLLYCLMRLRWRGQTVADASARPLQDAATDQSSHLARAERFAQQGSFVEAMHELLLEGFRLIRQRANERLADSLTSREILRATILPEPGRAALRAIVARVEWTYFGEHTATLADYRACRDSFDTLHSTLAQAAK